SPPPVLFAERITAALDLIRELAEELEAAGPDALEPEILTMLRERTDTGMGALRGVLGTFCKLPPAKAAVADRVLAALRAAADAGIAEAAMRLIDPGGISPSAVRAGCLARLKQIAAVLKRQSRNSARPRLKNCATVPPSLRSAGA